MTIIKLVSINLKIINRNKINNIRFIFKLKTRLKRNKRNIIVIVFISYAHKTKIKNNILNKSRTNLLMIMCVN